MNFNKERVIDYSVNLVGQAIGVESLVRAYREHSDPNSIKFTNSKISRIAHAALGWASQFSAPSNLRLAEAGYSQEAPKWLSQSYRLPAFAADIIVAALLPLTIAIPYDEPLIFFGTKAVANGIIHAGLDLTSNMLDKMKGAPIWTRV